jgi:hypothetical protein
MQARHFSADANSVSFEFDGRAGKDIIQAFLWVPKAKSGDTNIAVHVHFAVGTPDDSNITRDIRQFEPDRARNIQ